MIQVVQSSLENIETTRITCRPKVLQDQRHKGSKLILPLRKQTLDGVTYTRDPRIEGLLEKLYGLSREELLVRLAVTNRSDPLYVPSECLMHLVRASKRDNSDRHFGKLYELLMTRVLKSLPRADSAYSETTSLPLARIRDAVLDKLRFLLSADRQDYAEALDYFEVRFDGAIAKARLDAGEPVWREGRRTVTIELDEEIGADEEVEKALGGFDPYATSDYEEKDYRLKLDRAIDALPPEQKGIVEMLRQGFLIDSQDAEALTISKVMGKSEKTIRTHRDRAYDTLRAAFGKGPKS